VLKFKYTHKSFRDNFAGKRRMTLGTCCYNSDQGRKPMDPTAISIVGKQSGFIVSFTVTQTFKNNSDKQIEISYLVPNNSKICMYGTVFRIGTEVIRPTIQEKKAAERIYEEAKQQGRAAILAKNLPNGLVEFKIGNLSPGVECQVECLCAMTASSVDSKSMLVKFPLDCCTPSGSVGCIATKLKGSFLFSLTNTRSDEIEKVECTTPGPGDPANTRTESLQ
jgi:hypothetical protein